MKVKFKKWDCNVRFDKYRDNDRLAIKLVDANDGAPVAVATVNLPDSSLNEGEVIIKSWSENEGMSRSLVSAGIIGPSLRKIQTGFVHATVHQLITND